MKQRECKSLRPHRMGYWKGRNCGEEAELLTGARPDVTGRWDRGNILQEQRMQGSSGIQTKAAPETSCRSSSET